MSGPVRMEELAARLINAFVGVGAEVIALGLQEICRETFGAVTVVESQSGAERRDGNAFLGGHGHNVAPGALGFLDLAFEKLIQKQIRELRIFVEGFLDVPKEAAANDASTAPHQSDATVIEIPFVL